MNLVDASDGVDNMVVFPVLVGRGMCIQDKAGGTRQRHIGSLHCIGSSDSRNAYTVSDHPSSQGPLNPRIRYQIRDRKSVV